MAGFAISKGLAPASEAPSVDAWEQVKMNHALKLIDEG